MLARAPKNARPKSGLAQTGDQLQAKPMAGRWFIGVACAGVVAGVASNATADEPLVTSSTTGAATAARRPLLPSSERLQLSWPIAPLSFSFQASEQGNYAAGPLRLFRAEATWLRLGPLSLLTTSASERAFELDCRLTCQPALARRMAVEGRLHLFSTRAVPEAYLFAGHEASWSEARSSRASFSRKQRLWRIGFGGLLDL